MSATKDKDLEIEDDLARGMSTCVTARECEATDA